MDSRFPSAHGSLDSCLFRLTCFRLTSAQVVGGAEKGGILVRRGQAAQSGGPLSEFWANMSGHPQLQELASAALPDRLSTGAEDGLRKGSSLPNSHGYRTVSYSYHPITM